MPPGGDIIWGCVKVKEAPIRHNLFCLFLALTKVLKAGQLGCLPYFCEFYVK
jgi:hypothetical protein